MAPPSPVTRMPLLHEPYERFPTNELRRECYRRKLTVIKSGPLCNATKAGFMKLLRECDAPPNRNRNERRSGGDISPHTTLTAFNDMLDGGKKPSEPMMPTAPPTRALPPLDAASPPRRHVVSPPPSPPAAVLAPSRPPRPPRMDLSTDHRVFDVGDDRRPSVACEDGLTDGNKAPKKQKTLPSERHAIPDSQSTFSSQTSTGSTCGTSSLQNQQGEPMRVKVKKEDPSVASISIVTRWERLFARLEAVNEKLQSLRDAEDAWPLPIGGDDASDVEFYTIMKRQLQKELLDCVSST